MTESYKEEPCPRWTSLNREVLNLKDALNGFSLVGVLDRDTNHIASMQEEIDRKTREALAAYWISTGRL